MQGEDVVAGGGGLPGGGEVEIAVSRAAGGGQLVVAGGARVEGGVDLTAGGVTLRVTVAGRGLVFPTAQLRVDEI